jgi:hypothetical protein
MDIGIVLGIIFIVCITLFMCFVCLSKGEKQNLSDDIENIPRV